MNVDVFLRIKLFWNFWCSPNFALSGNRPALWQWAPGWREWWCDCGLDVVMLKPPNNSHSPVYLADMRNQNHNNGLVFLKIDVLLNLKSSLPGNSWKWNRLFVICVDCWQNCFRTKWIHRSGRFEFWRVFKTLLMWSGWGSGLSSWMMEARRLKRSSGIRVKMFGLTWTEETLLLSLKFTKGDGSSCLFSAC